MSSAVLVDIFGDIVARISAKLTPLLQTVNPNIIGVNYLYGVPLEISNVLTDWTKSETFEPKKYPLIALFQPFEEVNGREAGLAGIDRVRIIIAGLSNADWLTPERYTNNFKPILYPIYDELIEQIYFEPRISSLMRKAEHTKIDWPFWDDGKGKNPFSDKLDIIEIKNLKLNVRSKNC